ncbi:MAG TPA: (Fe-S)-binding protein [Bacteroidetes bacterium]|nr:succinate dehydrogenase/fumarate reductase iron-sulfur subunit [bacterium BMS3Bbin04]HDO66470.1 (Fe-S)-binding protein [Bacteroidota bacterium]HEX05595.1 (Fe-S)-binding protein [Bacteroidota bacterium]
MSCQYCGIQPNSVNDISKESEQLAKVDPKDLMPLPAPYDGDEYRPSIAQLKDSSREAHPASATLDGVLAAGAPEPKTKEEEDKIVQQFISGLRKLFTKENNWTFLQPLTLSMEHCARCQTCVDNCPVYEASGWNEIYRPTYRSEILRRLYFKYVRPGNKLLTKFQNNDIELNYTLIARLYELAYRCTLCRRCAQSCPVGVDNGLITHDLRKLFSQELGWAPKELHEKGTVQQLTVGSSTGMNSVVVKDNIEFIDEDISERVGWEVKTPWDVEGADVMLIENAGEFLAWPENHGCTAVILNKAGINWTMSSEIAGYDGVNYGLFYDDVQLARVATRHFQIAKDLGVKKIVMGECGHEHKALATIADRVGVDLAPRESILTLLADIVKSGKLKLDPSRNDFAITLHDPCNTVRNLGIVQPQRDVLKLIAPKFREMTPHGIHNYCCGGGSGFAIMSGNNFEDWRNLVSSRKKFAQVLNAFGDEDLNTDETKKYICAPCSNCKGALRDMLEFYGAKEKSGIYYGGLVELVVNAMPDTAEPLLDWDMM